MPCRQSWRPRSSRTFAGALRSANWHWGWKSSALTWAKRTSFGIVDQPRTDLMSLADAVSPKLAPKVVTHVRGCIEVGELALGLEELCAYMGQENVVRDR